MQNDANSKENCEMEMNERIGGSGKICDIVTQHYNQLRDNHKSLINICGKLSEIFEKVLLVHQKEIQELKETVKKHVNASVEQKRLLAEAESRSANQEQRTAEYWAKNVVLTLEKEHLKKQMEDFIATKRENERLAREVTYWKERSIEADGNCLKLEENLREVERRYGELEKSAREKGHRDADIIKELCKKLDSMEEEQKQRDINKELEIKGQLKQMEMTLFYMEIEKMLSLKECNLKNINDKLAETVEQKTSLQNVFQILKAINDKLEEELKRKGTTTKTKDLSIESIENEKDLTEKPVTDDTQYSSISTERNNLPTFTNKSTNEQFSKSSSSLKLAEASERDPYGFAKALLEEDLHESSSLHKYLRNQSFAKLNERQTLSQPAMESPFKIPNPPKKPSLTDRNTPPQKKKRFFVSDRNVTEEVSHPRKRRYWYSS